MPLLTRRHFFMLMAAGAPLSFFYGCATKKQSAPPSPESLAPCAFTPLPVGAVRPSGWLARQLRIQADGLSGHLDEFWPDIKESGWIGGPAEGWERVPYWLDGVAPLARLLDDPALKAKVQRYVDYALTHQQNDGWLGPEKSSSASGTYKPRDPWPVFVMLKVFTQYQEATEDPRVVPAMQRFLRCLQKQLAKRPLFEWNKSRWQDLVLSIYWLYDRTGEAWLLELADTAYRQGYDWEKHFGVLPFKEKVKLWQFESHVVNNAMAVKAPGLRARRTGNTADAAPARSVIETLDRYHGQAAGIFSGDECFAGKMPSQGTELCAVVEYMFSLETLLSIHGDPAFGDRLEKIAFNALPATFKPDMWAHQYVQQANQAVVQVTKDPIYTTNGPDTNLYGLEPNYGCCTANMHQGWPKLTTHLWMKSADGGIAAVAYAPSLCTTKIGKTPVKITLDTDYPFSDELTFSVAVDAPIAFPLHLRIPAWAEGATLTVNQEAPTPVAAGTFTRIDRQWSGVSTLSLKLPMTPRAERRFNNALSISRGPLVYSLKIAEDWRYLRGDLPHADWEVHPASPWNYALDADEAHIADQITFTAHPVGDVPFSAEGAPITAAIAGRLLPDWTLEHGAAAAPPPSPVASESPVESLTLIPYGCAHLRISEFPTTR